MTEKVRLENDRKIWPNRKCTTQQMEENTHT